MSSQNVIWKTQDIQNLHIINSSTCLSFFRKVQPIKPLKHRNYFSPNGFSKSRNFLLQFLTPPRKHKWKKGGHHQKFHSIPLKLFKKNPHKRPSRPLPAICVEPTSTWRWIPTSVESSALPRLPDTAQGKDVHSSLDRLGDFMGKPLPLDFFPSHEFE